MTPRNSPPGEASVASRLERRAARADALAAGSIHPETLSFAAGLYRAQAEVAAALDAGDVALSGALEADLAELLPALEPVVQYAEAHGPPGLRAEVDGYRSAGRSAGTARLVTWWRTQRAGRIDYLARAVLRPYAETLAARGIAPEPLAGPSMAGHAGCATCGGPAWISWRRSMAPDEAPQRFLGCGVCGSERRLVRIECAACGEGNPDKLPVFRGEQYPGVRLEACDACLRYVKSIDLTLDGRAIPEIDDLCSLSMDLWAAEQGYERLEPSLAGV